MARANLLSCFLILLLFFQCICISGKWGAEGFELNPETLEREKEQTLPKSSSKSGKRLNLGMKLDGSINQPGTSFPSTTPITNPANFPPYTPTPTIVTVPASNPTSVTPTNPLPTPITTVPTSPITNPAAPVTDPTTMNPGPVGGTGTGTGTGSWCIARPGTPESSLQSGLDYACGIGGADCSMIQEGASCYNPNSLENHASYAFNSYFQKNPVSTSCDFEGAAQLVNTNPSSGTCVYPSSSTTMTAQPATTTGVPSPSSTFPPATPTDFPSSTIPPGTTTSPGATGTSSGLPGYGGFDSPPSGSPGIFGIDSPPTGGNTMPAGSVVAAASQPLIGFTILVAFFSTGKLILGT